MDTCQDELSNRYVRGATEEETDPAQVRYGYHHVILKLLFASLEKN